MSTKLRHRSKKTIANKTVAKNQKPHSSVSDNGAAGLNETHQRITNLVAQGEIERALNYSKATGTGESAAHDQAVCLMRLGRFAEAVKILRKLVLNPDCVWMREDVPVYFKTNFATALLLNGHPAGCRSLLGEIDNEKLTAVIRLRAVLREWEKSMSIWQRVNWYWMGIEPGNLPIKFEGAAGEFEPFEVSLPLTHLSNTTVPSLKTAA